MNIIEQSQTLVPDITWNILNYTPKTFGVSSLLTQAPSATITLPDLSLVTSTLEFNILITEDSTAPVYVVPFDDATETINGVSVTPTAIQLPVGSVSVLNFRYLGSGNNWVMDIIVGGSVVNSRKFYGTIQQNGIMLGPSLIKAAGTENQIGEVQDSIRNAAGDYEIIFPDGTFHTGTTYIYVGTTDAESGPRILQVNAPYVAPYNKLLIKNFNINSAVLVDGFSTSITIEQVGRTS